MSGVPLKLTGLPDAVDVAFDAVVAALRATGAVEFSASFASRARVGRVLVAVVQPGRCAAGDPQVEWTPERVRVWMAAGRGPMAPVALCTVLWIDHPLSATVLGVEGSYRDLVDEVLRQLAAAWRRGAA